jgi:hypothetical protein
MTSPIIPSMNAEDAAEPSPAVVAQREVVSMAHSIFTLVASQRIAVDLNDAEAQCAKAVRMLKYADGIYAAECAKLDAIIASEALGQPVVVDANHTTIRLAPEAQH